MYTEDDTQTIVNGYLKDIKKRFARLLVEESAVKEDDQKEIMKLLGYACNHSKDDLTIADAYLKGSFR